MIEISNESHDAVLIAKVSGKVTVADYQDTVIPKLDSLLAEYAKVAALIEFGADFNGWEIKALWIDLQYGLKHRNDFSKLAMLGAPCCLGGLSQLASFFVSAEFKGFSITEREQALVWINAV